MNAALMCVITALALADKPPVAHPQPPVAHPQPPVAQPEPPVSQQASPPEQTQAAGSLEVSAQLWAVIARYRFAATADEVRVTLAQRNGRSDTHSLVIRCIPGPAGLARLELGDVVLVATRGRLTAIHKHDPTTYVEIAAANPEASPGEVLAELLPPLPIPHLSLAFDPEDVDWCPLVRELRWESAERTGDEGDRGVRLTGRSATGPASLDLASGRVRRLDAFLNGGSGLRLIVESRPIEPGDPAQWGLDTTGRRRLESLALLRRLDEPLTIGSRWPQISLSAADSRASIEWPAIESGSLAASSVLTAAWIFAADEPPERVEEMAGRALRAITELRREILRGRIDGRFDKRLALREVAGIALVEQEGGAFERIEVQQEVWRGAVGAAWSSAGEPPQLLWTAAEPRLLDRIAPGQSSAIVLMDGRGVILALAPISESSDPEATSGVLASGLPPVR